MVGGDVATLDFPKCMICGAPISLSLLQEVNKDAINQFNIAYELAVASNWKIIKKTLDQINDMVGLYNTFYSRIIFRHNLPKIFRMTCIYLQKGKAQAKSQM